MSEERFSETERNCYYTSLVLDNQTQEKLGTDKVVVLLNEQQSIIERLQGENLYKNFELKSVDDLKRLKGIFEICMVLIDYAIADEDLEVGYESVFQFERRIKKFGESGILERVRGYATED